MGDLGSKRGQPSLCIYHSSSFNAIAIVSHVEYFNVRLIIYSHKRELVCEIYIRNLNSLIISAFVPSAQIAHLANLERQNVRSILHLSFPVHFSISAGTKIYDPSFLSSDIVCPVRCLSEGHSSHLNHSVKSVS